MTYHLSSLKNVSSSDVDEAESGMVAAGTPCATACEMPPLTVATEVGIFKYFGLGTSFGAAVRSEQSFREYKNTLLDQSM